jgi:DNA-binding IclR family transcriptional regulator
VKRPPSLPDDRRYQVPGLERGLLILEYLDQHPAGRSMVEIARDLGLPKNAVFRITLTLLRGGYLERDLHTKRLFLGRKVLALGYGALGAGRGLVEQALPGMRALRDATRETVCVSVLVEGQGFVLEGMPGPHPFRCVVDPGMRQPLHASASCKAIVAHLPPAEVEALLAGVRLPRLTPSTLTQKAELLRHLAHVRQCGYATDCGEHIEGVNCIAAPIFDRHALPLASLTVTGPAGRLPQEAFSRLGPLVRQHADRIGRLRESPTVAVVGKPPPS